MDSEEQFLDKLACSIVAKMEPHIKEIVGKTVQEEVIKALKKALVDSEFYKGLSDDVMEGLGKIYAEIHATKSDVQLDSIIVGTMQTLDESQSALDHVLSITESSTLKIMDLIEWVQDKVRKLRLMVGTSDNSDELKNILNDIDRNLLEMLTLLSFQDVTGQKIKKVIEAFKKIEEIAFELYLSSEAFRKAKSEGFERSYGELRDEVKKQVEVLKKKKEIVDQNAIDEILSGLNL
ncbi:MAG: protein phosphatase CheZ [Thermodesulforhabdaceae bacterium]